MRSRARRLTDKFPQRLRFEFKERGLPTDGSYKPPGGTPSATASPSLSVKVPSSPIHRTVSTPVLESKDKPASKEMARTTSTAISRRESSGTGWTRPSSPSISLGAMAGAGRARSDSVSRAKTNVAKSITDTFDKARGHLNDAVFPKAISCYTEVAVETMSQLSFCLIQTEEYEEALTVLDFILHFKADHGKALIRKAKVYALMDDLAMADSYRVKALPLVRESDPELWEVNHMCEKSIALPPRAGVNGSFRETAIKTLPPVSPTKDISPRRTDSPITPPRGPASVPLGARAPPPAKFRTSSRGSQDIPVAGEAVPQEEAPTSPKGDGPISPKGASAPKKPAPQPPAKPLPMPRKPAESAEPVVKLTEDDDFLAIALSKQ